MGKRADELRAERADLAHRVSVLLDRVRAALPQYDVEMEDVGYWARVAGLPANVCVTDEQRSAWKQADEELRDETRLAESAPT